MADGDRTAQYELLRETAIRVLDAIGNAQEEPEALRNALVDLHLTVAGDAPITTSAELPHPTLDPERHLRSRFNYVDSTAHPVPLVEEAAEIRRELAEDRGRDDHSPGDPERNVHFTGLEAMIIGGMLQELAARLQPGDAFGPSNNGAELAAVATDLAWELLDQTFVGRS
ncbi:hypothetical protein [Nocardia iowensis]|uniref:TetR family transcriptional regulator n=1 Tax=Nocardia iowensis TaxID=204891 RepID=A0ABX8RWZ3_NOCIO|nr:hypothetical protein [Nocardia iowensis]QXN94184.1 hypothetical protein KV110_14635 [Nocardia iowensis]